MVRQKKFSRVVLFSLCFMFFLLLFQNSFFIVHAEDWSGTKDYLNRKDQSESQFSQSQSAIKAYLADAGIEGEKANEIAKEMEDKYYNVLTKLNLDELGAKNGPWDRFMELYNEILTYILGFGALSSFLIFIVIMLRLSAPADHPILRRKLMVDALVSLACTAILGAFGIFITLFYTPFRGILNNQLFLINDWRVSFSIMLMEYRVIIVATLAISTLAVTAMFIIGFMKLAASAGNPGARQKAISSLFMTGIATAGLGSVTLIVALFYNMFR